MYKYECSASLEVAKKGPIMGFQDMPATHLLMSFKAVRRLEADGILPYGILTFEDLITIKHASSAHKIYAVRSFMIFCSFYSHQKSGFVVDSHVEATFAWSCSEIYVNLSSHNILFAVLLFTSNCLASARVLNFGFTSICMMALCVGGTLR